MSDKDRDMLLAKIDTLRWSFSDTQMQAIMGVMHDVVASVSCSEDKQMGFSKRKAGEK